MAEKLKIKPMPTANSRLAGTVLGFGTSPSITQISSRPARFSCTIKMLRKFSGNVPNLDPCWKDLLSTLSVLAWGGTMSATSLGARP
jgi:hypothetical protein